MSSCTEQGCVASAAELLLVYVLAAECQRASAGGPDLAALSRRPGAVGV